MQTKRKWPCNDIMIMITKISDYRIRHDSKKYVVVGSLGGLCIAYRKQEAVTPYRTLQTYKLQTTIMH